MTLSPEAQAEPTALAILTLLGRSQISASEREQATSIISRALRDACNEKLEEVAAHYEKSESLISQQMADTIRTWKSEDTTP